jgi:hypothetical protein
MANIFAKLMADSRLQVLVFALERNDIVQQLLHGVEVVHLPRIEASACDLRRILYHRRALPFAWATSCYVDLRTTCITNAPASTKRVLATIT